jgi:hypothetical protein
MANNVIELDPAIESEFKRLMAKDPNGLLKPEEVVEEARSASNVFHDYFTWDDSSAAEKWRLNEARVLIRSCVIYSEELKVQVRALTSLEVDRGNEGGYRWTMDVLQRPDLRQQLMQTALDELNRVRTKYAHLEGLAEIWDAIDKQNALPDKKEKSNGFVAKPVLAN